MQRETSHQPQGRADEGQVILPGDVGWTGLMTAHMRAIESARQDRLFDDPLATAVVDLARHAIRTDPDGALPTGPKDDQGELTETWYMLSTFLGVRTRYYDSRVTAACAAGIRQLVVLAAGLDARAYRLELPADTTVYEVDTEPVLRFKESVLTRTRLEPTARRRTVVADLRGPWEAALTGVGFDPALPTMWLVEGLFMYLSGPQSERLLDGLTRLSAPGSRLALEYYESIPRPEDVSTVDAAEEAVIARILSFFQDGPPTPPDRWLPSHGWRPEVTTLAAEITARGRVIPEMFRKGRPHEVNLWLAHGTLG
ncbi:SAM-dependent methyltransferase [Streptomyces sp. NRRL WC-3744]|uniref:SAM-dependent methyltransferase n=1 Tax=Streptomyces sp. NRRL WC-3744 TaxID=1463935 RepID=UPI00131EAB32|nr:SAM-dependent methyltransferase [Streptomyces sp. NRRL WC-3744]